MPKKQELVHNENFLFTEFCVDAGKEAYVGVGCTDYKYHFNKLYPIGTPSPEVYLHKAQIE